jgi:two-component system sensor histidine kinase YesM
MQTHDTDNPSFFVKLEVSLKSILSLFRGKSIRFKLSLYFICLILLPILTLGILGSFTYINSIENMTNAHTVQLIEQVKNNVEFYIKDMESITYLISQYKETSDYLAIDGGTPMGQKTAVENSMKTRLKDFTNIHPEISGILVISKNDYCISNEIYRVARDPLTEEYWYKMASADPDKIHLISKPIGRNIKTNENYSPDDVVSIVKAIKNPDTAQTEGVVLIDMKLEIVDNAIRNIKLGKSGFVYIMGSDGNIVFAPANPVVYRINAEWISNMRNNSTVKEIKGIRYQILYSVSDYTKWKTIGIFPLNETLQEVSEVVKYSIIIGVLTLICAIIVAMFFTSSIVNPLNSLRMLMKKAESGDLTVQFKSAQDDEIGQLGNSFNNMIAEIQKLINMVYIEQKSKREAELKILRAQIRPHFLYNTLDTIQWMAQEHNADDIVQIVNALTNLFRIGLSKGKEMLTVHEELEHVLSYMIIQKARYEDKLEYEIICDPKVKDCSVLKLILQPLVENAIYHGIKEKAGVGKITIRAGKKDDKLLFTITDNGKGIQPEKMAEIKEMLQGRTAEGKIPGYGIFNVNEMIRLVFGNEYGLNIISIPEKGTTIEVWHPLIER